jgi:hypothetical protein
MSNDGTATPEPGAQPGSTGRPAAGGDDRSTPTAPAPSGYEAAPGTGPAPSGFEVPALAPDEPPTAPYGTASAPPASSEWPTAPFGTRAAGDQPTAAYGTPSADQPTSPYGVPPVHGVSGGYPAPGGYAAPGGSFASGGSAPAGYGDPAGAQQAGGPYSTPGYPQQGQPGYPQQPGGGYPPAGAGYPAAGGGYPPAGGGYPPAGGGPYPYGSAPYPGPQAPGTDGVSIAALVTSLLGMNVVAVVLGILGLRRTKKNGTQGRGLALTGLILGALELVAIVVVSIAVATAVVSHNNLVDSLRDDCAAGVMQACDDLYDESPVGSDDEEFGWTCGGRTEGSYSCVDLDAEQPAPSDDLVDPGAEGTDPGAAVGTYGSDPALDALWDACAAGSGLACDNLYLESPSGSEYEDFANTCGNRVEFAAQCEEWIGG